MKQIFCFILIFAGFLFIECAFADEKEFYSSPMQILRDRENAEGQMAEMTATFYEFTDDSENLMSFHKNGVFIGLIHKMDIESVRTFVLDHEKGDVFKIKFDITQVVITPQGLKMIFGSLISMEPAGK